MNHFYKLFGIFIFILLLGDSFVYVYFEKLDILEIVFIGMLNILYGCGFINILSSQTNNFYKQCRRLVFIW